MLWQICTFVSLGWPNAKNIQCVLRHRPSPYSNHTSENKQVEWYKLQCVILNISTFAILFRQSNLKTRNDSSNMEIKYYLKYQYEHCINLYNNRTVLWKFIVLILCTLGVESWSKEVIWVIVLTVTLWIHACSFLLLFPDVFSHRCILTAVPPSLSLNGLAFLSKLRSHSHINNLTEAPHTPLG